MSFEELDQHVIEFIRVHEAWTAPIVFALAFGESLALIAGALGAALGDWLSYWVGTRFKRSIAEMWPFSRHPYLLPRGEAFIKKWGALAIFIGRFSGPLRASVPIVAGVLGMPYRTFQLANFSSAFVWVAGFLELGDVGATISSWLWNDVAGRFST
jgi:membrane protein DedA with SNARE-associated domain